MAEKIKFEYGQPLELALKFNNGKNVAGKFGDQVLFTTVDDTVFYLDPEPASEVEHQLDELGIKPREFFRILKTKHARGGGSSFRIERLPNPETELVRQLEGSLAMRRPAARATEIGETPEARLWRLDAALMEREQREARSFGSAPPMAMTNQTHQPGPLATVPANRLEIQNITPANPAICAKLMAAFAASIDALAEAQAYAQRRGLAIIFTSEDARCVAISAFIEASRGGR